MCVYLHTYIKILYRHIFSPNCPNDVFRWLLLKQDLHIAFVFYAFIVPFNLEQSITYSFFHGTDFLGRPVEIFYRIAYILDLFVFSGCF